MVLSSNITVHMESLQSPYSTTLTSICYRTVKSSFQKLLVVVKHTLPFAENSMMESPKSTSKILEDPYFILELDPHCCIPSPSGSPYASRVSSNYFSLKLCVTEGQEQFEDAN